MTDASATHPKLGFHYFPDDAHYREEDLAAWLPELTSLGIAALTLTTTPARAVPEHFIRGLVANEIDPIIHLPVAPVRAADQDALNDQMRLYGAWGAKHVVVFAEPNSRAAWTPADWAKVGLIERFVDIVLPCLTGAQEAGLTPVFPPLAPGGDYWDTMFLDSALDILEKRAQPALLDNLAFGAYLWTYNRPLEWGEGGAARWPHSRPYLTPPTSQDQRGFRAFEWYDEVIKAHLGKSHPIICMAGGARLGDSTDPRYPALDEARHTALNLQITNLVLHGELPDYLHNISFWLLAAGGGSPVAAQAAFRPDGTTLPFVGALKQLAFQNQLARGAVGAAAKAMPARKQAAPRVERAAKNGVKPLYHYMLLPVFEWGVSDWHWGAALDYIKAFRPAVGFSANEAALARFITIVGNEQGISGEIETALKNAGCTVDRVSGKDGDETRARLVAMAQQNQRFQSGVDAR